MSLVSIILTTLNSERYVAHSISSCLEQTYADSELIVVDGGSTDRTLEIVASFSDPRIRLVHQADNEGKLPGALNLGMAEARGEYITWTQDDCWYEPEAIQTMAAYLEQHSDVGLVYTDYWRVDADGLRTCYHRVGDPELVTSEDVIQVCFLFRRGVYEAIGPQETRFFPVHEVPWRASVAARFPIAPLHHPLMNYIEHPASLTGRIGGWELGRMTARALVDVGLIDNATLRQRLGQLDIDEGYADLVFRADYGAFRRKVRAGVLRDWRSLWNLGLWKQYVLSLLPGRDARQQVLLANWKAELAATQERRLAEAGDS